LVSFDAQDEPMQNIRLTTWIKAPAERCFSLATCAEFHSLMAKFTAKGTPNGDLIDLCVGDRLIWPGHYLGLQLRYTTRLQFIRPCSYFQEVLDVGSFRHFEHDHHFTPMNGGTRVRDEIRFVIPQGLLGPMTAPLTRRYLFSRISLRNEILREVAESDLWMDYLEPMPRQPEMLPDAEPIFARSDAPPRISTVQMVPNRG
jgi:ligand-binding SRPBCC domain-containing protein